MSSESSIFRYATMRQPRILAFAGSARQQSYNKQLIRVAADMIEQAGGLATLIDLADYPLPLYDGDLEAETGIPDKAMALKQMFLEHQGLLLACPEYNSSMTPLLKNTLDWVSRQAEGEGPLACYKGKVVGLLSTSPGRLGGLRGLVHVRAILGNIGCLVIPTQQAIPNAGDTFDASGALHDQQQRASVERVCRQLVDVTGKLQAD